jgi:polygalacturonase
VLVQNDTISGTGIGGTASTSDNGPRIKSSATNGGTVSDVLYANVCMTGMRDPLDFDTHYSTASGSHIPSFTAIQVNGVRPVSSVSGAQPVFDGYNASYPLGVVLENVSLDTTAYTAEYAKTGLYHSNVSPSSGTDVSTYSTSAAGAVPSCTFPSFPSV